MEDNHNNNSEEANDSHGEIESGVSSGGGSTVAETETRVKRKRGSPRKYEHEYMESPPLALESSSFSLNSSTKRRRGRPKGSGKLQALASIGGYFAETAGGNFSPYVLKVNTGEDIADKVISLLRRPPRSALCILSAAGMVSGVVIRQPGSPNGVLTFTGCFEILSLSGSYTCGEAGNNPRVMGMLSVSLATPDGRVFGGVVAGSLIADGPIQLVVATFKQNIVKELKGRCSSDSSTAASRFGDSKMARVPLTRMTDDIENSSTPTITRLTLAHEGVDTAVAANQNLSPISAYNVDGNALQVLQPISAKEISPDSVIIENQTSSPASSHGIDENALQALQPDQEKSLDITNAEKQDPSPSSLHSDTENGLRVLQPMSGTGRFPDSITVENRISSPASLQNIDESALQVLQRISDEETSPNTILSENQNLRSSSLNNVNENQSQVWQLKSDRLISPDGVTAENRISNPTSLLSVSENAMQQISQPTSHQEISPDMTTAENQNSCPTSMHDASENALQFLQTISDEGMPLDTIPVKNRVSSPASPNIIGESVISQPMSDQETFSVTTTAEKPNSNPTSLHNVGEDTLQVQQPISEQKTSPNANIFESKESPISLHSVDEM